MVLRYPRSFRPMPSLADEIALVERHFAALSRGDIEAVLAETVDDLVYDLRNSNAPWKGIYRSGEESRAAYAQIDDAFDELAWEPGAISPAPGRRIVCESRLRGRGRGSGIEVDARGDRKSTRLNSSHANISYAVFCLKKK